MPFNQYNQTNDFFSGKCGIKLLGVPPIPTERIEKTGPLIAEATYILLQKWNCVKCIQTMVFDTTSVNTGHVTAACISIQEQLNRQLKFPKDLEFQFLPV